MRVPAWLKRFGKYALIAFLVFEATQIILGLVVGIYFGLRWHGLL